MNRLTGIIILSAFGFCFYEADLLASSTEKKRVTFPWQDQSVTV
jgi:hypothetical protein